MLRSLRVRNLVILEDVSLEFGPGLNVLTGETGAGKSILVDAVGLVTGDRADRDLVRAGEERAVVEALFEGVGRGAVAELAAASGLELDGEDVVVRRVVSSAGSGRAHQAWINGSPCTQGMLRSLGILLLELHGQHEQQSLLSADRHLELLDRQGGHDELLGAAAGAYREVRRLRTALDALQLRAAERASRAEALADTVRAIDAVAPEPGESDRLAGEAARLRHAAEIRALLDRLVAATYEGDDAAATGLAGAARSAAEAAQLDPGLAELAERLSEAAVEVEDIGAGFREYRDGASFEPTRLEGLEERRVAIERLLLHYGRNEAEVLAARDAAQAELDGLAGIDDELDAARGEVRRAEIAYVEAAAALGAARRAAAVRLGPLVERQLKALALERARIDIAFTPAKGEAVEGAAGEAVPLAARGAERAELLLAANPGEPFRPLRKVASGGELSRVMLALHGVFESAGEARALVFDEVDSGVGGAVADAIGEQLSRLAARHQALCVTHLPQVAAWADRHFVVRKRVEGERTRAEVVQLSRDERVEEVARMLGGKRTTAVTRRHAAELLRSS